MIRNRLSVLLAERDLKITRVSKDTGISRSTLNNISKNETDMIRLETVNTLCMYLNVTPGEFFEFRPKDIYFTLMINEMPFSYDESSCLFSFRQMDADLFVDIKNTEIIETFQLNCSLDLDNTFYRSDSIPFDTDNKFTVNLKFEKEEDRIRFLKYYSDLKPFYTDIYDDLKATIGDAFKNHLDNEMEIIAKAYHNNDAEETIIFGIGIFEIVINSSDFLPF